MRYRFQPHFKHNFRRACAPGRKWSLLPQLCNGGTWCQHPPRSPGVLCNRRESCQGPAHKASSRLFGAVAPIDPRRLPAICAIAATFLITWHLCNLLSAPDPITEHLNATLYFYCLWGISGTLKSDAEVRVLHSYTQHLWALQAPSTGTDMHTRTSQVRFTCIGNDVRFLNFCGRSG